MPADGNPYPGLRPFDRRDSRVFFGRDLQIDELLDRLDRDRFLAVVGSSASGKSSLVRAGLLPALYGGHLSAAGSRWRVVVMRPGGAAIPALAAALDRSGLLGTDANEAVRVGLARAVLEAGELGLVEVIREARLPADENVLVVVDQFEELFRFRHDRDDAPAFVKLLLNAAEGRDVPAYVLLTMRSDFLGDCSQFRDLPEAVSGGLFLVPRLTRDQLREAIEGPAAIAGGEISPVLVNQLLNELGDSPDQLPVLQHALMRTWDLRNASSGGEVPVGLDDFAATGGLARALSIHGDIVYDALPDHVKPVAEKAFRALTDRASDERGVRRPATLAELCAIVGASRVDVVSVLEAFRATDVSFVMPPANVPLEDATVVDISHESLMRVWKRLADWADNEARAARTYRRIADAAESYEQETGGLLIDPALTVDLAWRDENAPTAAWAQRYVPGSFEGAMRFLDASAEQRSRAALAAGAARRRRAVTATAVTFASIVAVLSIVALVVLQRERGAILAQRSQALARDAENAVDRGDAVTGGLLALAALPQSLAHPDRPFTLAAYDALQRAFASRRERLDLVGHTAAVYRVAFSPDGRRVATASADGTARIWDASTGAVVHIFHDENGYMTSASWSSDGTRFLTSSGDRTARIWDATTFAPLVVMRGHTANVLTAQFSPDGRHVLTSSFDGTARVFDARTGRQRLVLHSKADESLWSARYSPDGRYAITASVNDGARIWDLETGHELHHLAAGGSMEWAAYSPDGTRVVTAADDHTVRVWDAASGRQVYAVRGDDPTFYCATFSPDGRYLVTSSHDYSAQMRDARTGDVLFVLGGADGRLWSVAFSPDGRRVVSGSGDGIARIWDVTIPKPSLTLRILRTGASARFSHDGRRIVTASGDGVARVWDVASGAQILTLRGHTMGLTDAVFSNDGRRIVTASADGTARVWDARTGALLRVLRGHRDIVESVRFTPDDRDVITGSDDRTVRVWNVASGAGVLVLTGADWQVFAVAVSPDGRRIAGAANDSTVRVWDAKTGRQQLILKQHDSTLTSVEFSPDGRRLLTASDDRVAREWDARTGALLTTFTGHAAAVSTASYSPDGRSIVTASNDETARVWDAASGSTVLVIRGHGALANAVYSPDGRSILISSVDGTAEVFVLPVLPKCQDLIDAAARAEPRALSEDQLRAESLEPGRQSPILAAFMGGERCSE